LDLRAQNAIAVHWGTFQLTSEPILEPKEKLKVAAEAAGIGDAFHCLEHGEIRHFPL
jgi:L-ascorbate metabolism protein UlaG (beta-lactamase superfamily)